MIIKAEFCVSGVRLEETLDFKYELIPLYFSMASVKYEHASLTQNCCSAGPYLLSISSGPSLGSGEMSLQADGEGQGRCLLEDEGIDPAGGQDMGKGGKNSKSKKPRTCIMVGMNLQDKCLPFLPGIFLEKSGVLENVLPIPELEAVSSLEGRSCSLFVALSL